MDKFPPVMLMSDSVKSVADSESTKLSDAVLPELSDATSDEIAMSGGRVSIVKVTALSASLPS